MCSDWQYSARNLIKRDGQNGTQTGRARFARRGRPVCKRDTQSGKRDAPLANGTPKKANGTPRLQTGHKRDTNGTQTGGQWGPTKIIN